MDKRHNLVRGMGLGAVGPLGLHGGPGMGAPGAALTAEGCQLPDHETCLTLVSSYMSSTFWPLLMALQGPWLTSATLQQALA